jgi:hypothetical protein
VLAGFFIAHGGGRPEPILDFVRRFTTSPFIALPNTVLLSTNTNATAKGGNCALDSGSPQFLSTGGGDVLAAVAVEKADAACGANAFNYRPGTTFACAFLSQFASLGHHAASEPGARYSPQ